MAIPEFIKDLRSKIGHDLLWLPVVTAVVFDHDDRVLLVHRADNGRWAPVTGIVDPGEQPAIAAVREVLEETRIVAEVERLVSVRAAEPTRHVNGDWAQYLDMTFRCGYQSGSPAVGDDESDEVGWFALDDLPPMAGVLRERIGYAAEPAAEVIFDR